MVMELNIARSHFVKFPTIMTAVTGQWINKWTEVCSRMLDGSEEHGTECASPPMLKAFHEAKAQLDTDGATNESRLCAMFIRGAQFLIDQLRRDADECTATGPGCSVGTQVSSVSGIFLSRHILEACRLRLRLKRVERAVAERAASCFVAAESILAAELAASTLDESSRVDQSTDVTASILERRMSRPVAKMCEGIVNVQRAIVSQWCRHEGVKPESLRRVVALSKSEMPAAPKATMVKTFRSIASEANLESRNPIFLCRRCREDGRSQTTHAPEVVSIQLPSDSHSVPLAPVKPPPNQRSVAGGNVRSKAAAAVPINLWTCRKTRL